MKWLDGWNDWARGNNAERLDILGNNAERCPTMRWPTIGLGLTLLLIGCHREQQAIETPEPIRPVLSVAAAPRGGVENGYSGTVEPRYQTNLSFRLLGQIVTREVNVGDQVKAGQTLATIDPVVLQIAVDSAEAALANAMAQSENAKGSLERQTQLLAKNATSQSEFDIAQKNAEAASQQSPKLKRIWIRRKRN